MSSGQKLVTAVTTYRFAFLTVVQEEFDRFTSCSCACIDKCVGGLPSLDESHYTFDCAIAISMLVSDRVWHMLIWRCGFLYSEYLTDLNGWHMNLY
eukprot:244775-Amphidinium_carterae.2